MTTVPLLVRNGIMSRLQAMTFFSTGGFHYSTNKAYQIQPQSIPFLGVYMISSTQSPDGDANAGEVRFRTFARYGISVIVQNNNPATAETKLDQAEETIEQIYADPTFYNNASFKIQGFAAGDRSHQFGSIGQDNELPIAELRYEISCDLGTITYPPTIVDDLETIHVKTAFPIGGTAEEQQAVKQVEAEYDLEQNP